MARGAIFGFLGPNGAGKSTTIRVLLGLLRPTSGRARVLDLDCWRDGRRFKREVGYLPGDLRLYPWLCGRVALGILGRVHGRDLEVPGRELAAEFRLDLDVRVRQMSRGMRQRLGLILALVHRPKLLILDEPSGGLDPLTQDVLYEHLRGAARQGQTVFLSSHVLGEVERLCDEVAMLREGRLILRSSLADLRARARREVTLVWRDGGGAARPVPPFLDVERRGDERWHATLRGSPAELLAWAAAQPLADLTLGAPDLEHLFRRYYAAGDEAGSC